MKLRHKAELKALQSQPAKGIGAKKKQKDDEKLMLQRHDAELKALEQQPPTATAATADSTPTQPDPSAAADESTAAEVEVKDDEQRNKPSRAQQKRDKRSQKDKVRQAEVAASVAHMADPRADEMQRLSHWLAPRRLAVEEVISDGHCLFRAVSHQLSLLQPPPLPANASSHTALRRAASSYMERHMQRFLPYLMREEDGEMMTAAEAADYVKALQRVDGDVVWGGHAECVALSGVVGRPLHVWSAEGGEMVVTSAASGNAEGGGEDGTAGKADGSDGRDVQISFHKYYFGLGNHYNSVIPATVEPDDDDQ